MLRNKIIAGTGGLAILLAGIVAFILPFLTTSCVSPGAATVDARLGVVEDNFSQLKSAVDNNIESVDTLKQQLLEVNKTINNSGVIKNYGGSWAVIVGMSTVIIIFLLSIFWSIKYYIKSGKVTNMLSLVVSAIKNLEPEISDVVKAQITKDTSGDGEFNTQDKKQLSEFVKNN